MNETAIAGPMKKDNSRVPASHHDLESWGIPIPRHTKWTASPEPDSACLPPLRLCMNT